MKTEQLTLEDLQHYQCRYPLGEINARPKYFCGKTRWSNYSYCEEHTRLCAKDGMIIKLC